VDHAGSAQASNPEAGKPDTLYKSSATEQTAYVHD